MEREPPTLSAGRSTNLGCEGARFTLPPGPVTLASVRESTSAACLRLALRPRYERAEVEYPYPFEGAHDLPPARAARSITDDVTNVRFAPIPVTHELISVFVKSYQ
jgi:hypothetical protein